MRLELLGAMAELRLQAASQHAQGLEIGRGHGMSQWEDWEGEDCPDEQGFREHCAQQGDGQVRRGKAQAPRGQASCGRGRRLVDLRPKLALWKREEVGTDQYDRIRSKCEQINAFFSMNFVCWTYAWLSRTRTWPIARLSERY